MEILVVDYNHLCHREKTKKLFEAAAGRVVYLYLSFIVMETVTMFRSN